MIKWPKLTTLLMCMALMSACTQHGSIRPTQHVAPDPDAAEINVQLGLNYLQRGDYAVALDKLEKALKQNPNSPTAHNAIALLYQRLGELDKAEKHFLEAVNRAPDYSEAQNNFGVFLCSDKRYDAAEKRFVLAAENPLYQKAPLAFENAGLCLMRKPDYAAAEAYFRKALQMAPKLGKSLISMADISYDQANYLQARAYVERYKADNRWTPSALYTAIKTENKLDDQDAVSSYILFLRSQFPDSDEVQLVNKGQLD
jgi:type IV pilus assembly protein PilF